VIRKRHPEKLFERIQTKAYEFYITRGAWHGHDFDDWIAAERVVLKQMNEPEEN
jgi:hypothetical protein